MLWTDESWWDQEVECMWDARENRKCWGGAWCLQTTVSEGFIQGSRSNEEKRLPLKVLQSPVAVLYWSRPCHAAEQQFKACVWAMQNQWGEETGCLWSISTGSLSWTGQHSDQIWTLLRSLLLVWGERNNQYNDFFFLNKQFLNVQNDEKSISKFTNTIIIMCGCFWALSWTHLNYFFSLESSGRCTIDFFQWYRR